MCIPNIFVKSSSVQGRRAIVSIIAVSVSFLYDCIFFLSGDAAIISSLSNFHKSTTRCISSLVAPLRFDNVPGLSKVFN